MKDKDKRAVALEYKRESSLAPRVTAKGVGRGAQQIEMIARKENVPVMDIPGLAESLYRVEIGREIPEEFYGITAEILSFVYSLEEKE